MRTITMRDFHRVSPRAPDGKSRRHHHNGAFTLLEAMLAIVIVGLGITGLLMVAASGTTVNAYGNELSAAVLLAEELRAMTDVMPYDNLTALNGATFNGVDAHGDNVPNMQQYQQTLDIAEVSPTSLTASSGTDMIKITATVSKNTTDLIQISWLRVR